MFLPVSRCDEVDPTTVQEVTISPEDARVLAAWADEKERAIKGHNDFIREVYAKGGGLREIARLVRMSHPGVKHIVMPPEAHYGPSSDPSADIQETEESS